MCITQVPGFESELPGFSQLLCAGALLGAGLEEAVRAREWSQCQEETHRALP